MSRLVKLLIWLNAQSLASVIRAETTSQWGGTRIDPLTFLVRKDSKSKFYWRVVADCDNPSRTGYGNSEQISLRVHNGFATKEGAIGHISEVVRFLAPRFPDVRMVLQAIPDDPLWFSRKTNKWLPFPERTWQCRACDVLQVWPPFVGARDEIPLCGYCDQIMREVRIESAIENHD